MTDGSALETVPRVAKLIKHLFDDAGAKLKTLGKTKMKLSRLFLASLVSATCVSANASEVAATVAELTVDKAYNVVLIRMSSVPASMAGCATNGYWHYTLPMASEVDKRLFALLTVARSTSTVVRVIGTGGCAELGTIESASRVSM